MIKVVVHEFLMSDVEDPDLYAAGPLMEWQHSESGKWVMENAIKKPEWFKTTDMRTYGYKYRVVALLEDRDATYYNLKWGNK